MADVFLTILINLFVRAAREVPAAAVPGASGDGGSRREREEVEERVSKRVKASAAENTLAV